MALKTQMLLFIGFAGASLCFAIFTDIVQNPLLDFVFAIIALIFAVIAFSTKYYTYLYIPALRSKNRNIVLNSREAFILSPSGTSILVHDENGTYASAFVKIPIYRSATEMTTEEKTDFSRLFSRLLTLSKSTVKFSTQMYLVSKDEYITKIHAKIEQSEERLRNITSEQAKQQGGVADRVKGEVAMWHNLLNSISSSRSSSLLSYAMVSAEGGNDEEASAIAYQRAEEIAAGISSVMGVTAYVAKGDELLTLIEPEYMIPVETVNEMIRQKSMAEGI